MNDLILKQQERFDKVWDLGLGILFDDGAGSYGKYEMVRLELKSLMLQNAREIVEEMIKWIEEELKEESKWGDTEKYDTLEYILTKLNNDLSELNK